MEKSEEKNLTHEQRPHLEITFFLAILLEVNISIYLHRRQPAVPSQQSPLARPTSHSVTLPQGWTPMSSDQDVSMVTLQRSSPEYLRVEAKFNITLRGKTIHKIERVQNIDLWESYSR